MKKIILLMNNYCGYEEKIIEELKKFNFEVEHFNYTELYERYRKKNNIFIRIVNNFFYKPIMKKNLKDILTIKKINKLLEEEKYSGDIFIKIGTMKLEKSTLEILRKKYSKMILHYWDNIGGFLTEENFMSERNFFDQISSYDRKDSIKYTIGYLPNFYSIKDNRKLKIENEVYTIMADKSRFYLLEKIAKYLKKKNINYNIILVEKREKIKSDFIKIQNFFIPIDEMLKEFENSKAILELQRPENRGYTFRTFDCIGMKKKLITNNREIINEDFYNPNNILIIDENNIEIPKEFIDSPYEDLPKEIYEKYSLENWVKQLLDIR